MEAVEAVEVLEIGRLPTAGRAAGAAAGRADGAFERAAGGGGGVAASNLALPFAKGEPLGAERRRLLESAHAERIVLVVVECGFQTVGGEQDAAIKRAILLDTPVTVNAVEATRARLFALGSGWARRDSGRRGRDGWCVCGWP